MLAMVDRCDLRPQTTNSAALVAKVPEASVSSASKRKKSEEKAGTLADKLARDQAKADFKRMAKNKVTKQMKREARAKVRQEFAEQGLERTDEEIEKGRKNA